MAPSCPRYFFRLFGFSSVRHEPCPTTNFSYFLLPLTGRSPHFRFRVPSQSFGYSLLPSWPGDPLGLLYVTPYPILFPSGHQVQTCFSILTWICYFGIDLHYYHVLTVVIIFLSSQCDTTWQYIYIYIYIYRFRVRCPCCDGYRGRKWTRRHEFKS